jgi:hypothetical protein
MPIRKADRYLANVLAQMHKVFINHTRLYQQSVQIVDEKAYHFT